MLLQVFTSGPKSDNNSWQKRGRRSYGMEGTYLIKLKRIIGSNISRWLSDKFVDTLSRMLTLFTVLAKRRERGA